MKYMLLIYGNQSREEFEALSGDEKQALYADWAAVREAPGVTTGTELAPPAAARTVRVKDGKPLTTDGPFAETKEALGGYFFLEADDLDAAVELAARVPNARMGGAIEVRPLVER